MGFDDHRILFRELIGRVASFATRYRELGADENSGRTGVCFRRLSVRAQTLRIDGIGHGDRYEWIFDLRIAWAVSCKTIYRWIREKIKQRMVKSGSRNLDVVRHCRGSRLVE